VARGPWLPAPCATCREEWGNPNTPKFFDYMLSYSPIDNVRRQRYPHILITAGLFDPRVAYWEPAKWASKLRATQAEGSGLVVAKFDLDSGHFSASDRYKWISEKSYDQAFVLDKLGLAEVTSKAKVTTSSL
jgi:oligopeptidase B